MLVKCYRRRAGARRFRANGVFLYAARWIRTVKNQAGNGPRAWAVVPAAGSGRRMGLTTPKQYVEVAGAPLLVHTLRALRACPLLEATVLVVPPDDLERARGMVAAHGLDRGDPIVQLVAGGETRQASVHAGLKAVPPEVAVVAVHDAARPFPDPERLATAIRMAAEGQVGVVVGRPASDTIKRVADGDRVVETPDRARLWQAFTPQVFPAKMIAAAYEAAARGGPGGTDDAALVETHGGAVIMLEGGREALKVTTPDDLITARAWLGDTG
jgi:2-C-methyl-D-erythritol 4-phosphate cytidylyltransferase